ncbi:EF-hand domain-containing protein 1-like [Mytilus californianus]|uniref:EF-hand domain-containing protein 1-like n=1 Tax=Mytilus californianus TaxID=6549 RepID=UPI002245DAE6|nr:EF-hand domain-containing protein 1-like [Mytilus californianus]
MEGLPFLPGNNFRDPTKWKYHRSHTLNYKNGYSIPGRPEVGIGGEPIVYNQLSEQELDDLANYSPTLTYGQAKQAPPEDFVPGHVAWDKKVLRFNAYFKQTVHESPDEYFRVRPVDIFYYLEDDSISVVEPHVENSGMPQGKLIKRQRLPKNDQGDNWHWKDLNNGMNVTFYGKIFRIVNCDQFTQNFLESEGLDVNPGEGLPTDPYIERRKEKAALRTYTTASAFDAKKQFLELDRKVLRLYVVWDDTNQMFGEMRPFVIHYYLVDDTLEVREVHNANDGRDPFPVLIGRHKVPKNRYNVESSFPAVVMELSDHEIKQYYTPKDFKIGETVTVYGRRFLVYDCDNFTKAFYYQNFGITDFNTVDVQEKVKNLPKMEIPPYNNFGSLEDSLQSCLSLIPQPPKKDFIKMLENDHKVLRFEATMDSVRPEDRGRRFIVSYRLADDMMTIYEPPVRNSGIIGGKFLERTRVAKPGCAPGQPVFYGPQDFYIGAVIDVFKHRFVITNADEYVLKYMEDHSAQFPAETVQTLRERLTTRPMETVKGGPMKVMRSPGDLEILVRQVRAQLKKIAITDKARVDTMFLRYNKDRTGYIGADDMTALCRSLQLPVDDDVINELVRQCTSNPEGKISLEDFRRFIECS